MLATELEERWRQRVGAAWLKLGDNNTKYFHAVANGRKNLNAVTGLRSESGQLLNNNELNGELLAHYKVLLGTKRTTRRAFDMTGKVGPPLANELESLDQEITDEEIKAALYLLPKGKSSDGLPAEFFQPFWEIVGRDVIDFIKGFLSGKDIGCVNRASITLILKKQGASQISDFRPISVINTMAKIITKLMANRLQPHLKHLVSNTQTTFVKGRSIMESFLVAREYLNFCQKMKIPSILLKVDFAKTFDMVNWSFLTNLLIERGFPPKWLSAMISVLKSSSSAIKVNSSLTPFFKHERGLRQGDPLSPMLFILVTDSLNWFIKNSMPLMHRLMIIQPRPIQYVDDTVIFTEAHPTSLKIIARILKVYARLTGLKINNHKSNFIPIAIPPNLVTNIERILHCTKTEFPIRYLGLPLSHRKPRKVDFQPLLGAVQARLAGWKSNLLSYGGRITLIKAVLIALPLHYMQAIHVPKGVIKHIDKARRSFLWKGNENCKGINCLVGWEKVCALKSNGGMGILDLDTQNQALLIKWMWKLDTEISGMWAQTVSKLYGSLRRDQLAISSQCSFFMRSVLDLSPFYRVSITEHPVSNMVGWRWTTSCIFTTASAYA